MSVLSSSKEYFDIHLPRGCEQTIKLSSVTMPKITSSGAEIFFVAILNLE
jgi:hypothetical protein